MNMFKKHFQMIADTIAEVRNLPHSKHEKEAELVRGTMDVLASRLATRLERDSPCFERSRFLRACNWGTVSSLDLKPGE